MNGNVKTGMHLLAVVLFDRSCLEDIILGLTSVSGGCVTMVDGVSGAENLSQSIPMFAEFAEMGGKRFCKVLFTCVSEPDPVSHLLEVLQDGGIDFVDSAAGEIYDIPLGKAVILEE